MNSRGWSATHEKQARMRGEATSLVYARGAYTRIPVCVCMCVHVACMSMLGSYVACVRGRARTIPSDKCKRDLVARVPVADEVFGRGRGWHLLHRINEGVMDRETRKNHPDEVFRIQFDLEEKREGGGGEKGKQDHRSRGFSFASFPRRLIVLWERNEVVVWYLEEWFFFCFSLSLFFNVDLNEFIRASDYEWWIDAVFNIRFDPLNYSGTWFP